MYHKFVVAFLFSRSESRQRVDPHVVLFADVLHRYPFEPDNKVGGRMVVPLQQWFLQFELLLYLTDHQLGVAFTCYFASSHVVRQV